MSQVYKKYWKWYKAVITSRCLPTRMLLVQGWYCLWSYQPCRFLLDTGHRPLYIQDQHWVWPIWWIPRAPIPIVEAPHKTLLDLWWSSLKLPPQNGEWGEYLLLTQPDLILRPSLWEVGLTVGAVHLNKEKLWMVAEATSQGHRRVLSPHVGIGHSF